MAIERLTGQSPVVPIDRGADCAPVWPEGIVGSITHTEGFVSAAVGWASEFRGLGIDSEQIPGAARLDAIEPTIGTASELRVAQRAGLDRAQATMLVFSVKEAIFKSVYPLVRERFYFDAAELATVDGATRTFEARMLRALGSQIAAGAMLQGRFEVDRLFVHTGVAVPVRG